MALVSTIILQLQAVLPTFTPLFSDDLAIASLVRSGSVVTATTAAPHGLTNRALVTIVGAVAPVVITSLTFSSSTDVYGNTIYIAHALVDTNTPHDLTLNPIDGFRMPFTISGVDQAIYNGSDFKLLSVPNRFEFTYLLPSNPVVNGSGMTMFLWDGRDRGYNGIKNVTITGLNTFTYSISQTPYSPALGTIRGRTNYRISGSESIERAIEAYTRQGKNQLWGFMVNEGSATNKDRMIMNDGTYSYMAGTDYRQKVIQKMTFYVFIPTITEIAALNSSDLMQNVAVFLFRSILGFNPQVLLSSPTPFGITFAGNSFYDYAKAYYIHRFDFEVLEEITSGDIVQQSQNVAFRDIDIAFANDPGTAITLGVNLDDQPYSP